MRAANFVEETTTSIAGTGGNGAVTLTAVTGRPRFSTVFGTQATTIRYVIEDTTTGKFETGVGVVSANVLTRTRPQVTWDGTTYDDSTPAPLAFGSAPASGNVRVRMAATAESQAPVIPGVNTTIAGGNFFDYPLTNNAVNAAGNGDVVTANREYYACYRLDVSGLLVGRQINLNAAVAGAGLKTALYAVGPNGMPGKKIVDFNAVSAATTGDKVDTATATWSTGGPVWLPAGWYYVAYISDQAITIGGQAVNNALMDRTPLGRSNGYGYGNTVYASGSYAAGLPADPAPTAMLSASNALSVPHFGLRVIP